ncbi:MAG: SDR family oxidoreductase [Rhodovibrionaceae bacterium]
MEEIAVVTGGSHGIGRAIVARLAKEGYLTANLDISNPPEGQNGVFRKTNLSDHEETESVLRELAADYRITRIVNNVGTIQPGAIETASFAEVSTAVGLNWIPAVQALQVALPGMRQAGFGRIVNISSRSALGRPERSAYSMTKGGVIGLTRGWASELAEAGITVNAIGPGPIETEMFIGTHPPGDPKRGKVLSLVPMRRMGQPEEVAQAAAFFLDSRSGYITGQVMFVCGGMSLGLQLP